jgi:hypothetical protein
MDLLLKLDPDHFTVDDAKKRIGYEKMDVPLEIVLLIYFVSDFFVICLYFLKKYYIFYYNF